MDPMRSNKTIQKENGCAVNKTQSYSEQIEHSFQKKDDYDLGIIYLFLPFLEMQSIIAHRELS